MICNFLFFPLTRPYPLLGVAAPCVRFAEEGGAPTPLGSGASAGSHELLPVPPVLVAEQGATARRKVQLPRCVLESLAPLVQGAKESARGS